MDSRYQLMKQINDRREAIRQFMQPYMEDKFDETYHGIMAELEKQGSTVWRALKEIIVKIAGDALAMQEEGKKGNIRYLVFSFAIRSFYLEQLELRIDLLDEGFYLDEQETAGYYCPDFLQERYRQDLECLYHDMRSKFVRIQEYENAAVREAYMEFYNAFLYRMVESMRELLVKTVKESGVGMASGFRILYGEYMGSAAVLYEEE